MWFEILVPGMLRYSCFLLNRCGVSPTNLFEGNRVQMQGVLLREGVKWPR